MYGVRRKKGGRQGAREWGGETITMKYKKKEAGRKSREGGRGRAPHQERTGLGKTKEGKLKE